MLLLILLNNVADYWTTKYARSKFLASVKNQAGYYLVTKVWYSDGHKSSNIVYAKDAMAAYEMESDDRRNLDYFIESCAKCHQVKL